MRHDANGSYRTTGTQNSQSVNGQPPLFRTVVEEIGAEQLPLLHHPLLPTSAARRQPEKRQIEARARPARLPSQGAQCRLVRRPCASFGKLRMIGQHAMRVDLFDFGLPPDRIALRPASPRDSARLLVVAAGERRD
ncbi:MAG: S-adenosylmethionine:tRNA ribosyltransferase-isomerase, partial [Verrucomicrobiota bacterium]|nr:S-adenosylmethionine:tRNA ribosyltransferase-isomerase [Verrucomicrobiota bacterium]